MVFLYKGLLIVFIIVIIIYFLFTVFENLFWKYFHKFSGRIAFFWNLMQLSKGPRTAHKVFPKFGKFREFWKHFLECSPYLAVFWFNLILVLILMNQKSCRFIWYMIWPSKGLPSALKTLHKDVMQIIKSSNGKHRVSRDLLAQSDHSFNQLIEEEMFFHLMYNMAL